MVRKYYGSPYANKCYRGNKSINLVLEKMEAIKLAKSLLAAALEKKKLDVAVYDFRKSKSNKIYTTVTSASD